MRTYEVSDYFGSFLRSTSDDYEIASLVTRDRRIARRIVRRCRRMGMRTVRFVIASRHIATLYR